MQKRLFYEPDARGVGTGHRTFFCARFYYEMQIIINAVSHEIKIFAYYTKLMYTSIINSVIIWVSRCWAGAVLVHGPLINFERVVAMAKKLMGIRSSLLVSIGKLWWLMRFKML